jgi:mono/diheme cytochrome c family protein
VSTSLAAALALNALLLAAQEPALPWRGHTHGLDEAKVGELLLEELRCAACHVELGEVVPPGPDLGTVGWRVSPAHLERFLVAPAEAQPGTKMPALLADLAPKERVSAAQALTHYLAAGVEQPFAEQQVDAADAEAGRGLFHTIGCVACHGPLGPGSTGAGEEEELEHEEAEDGEPLEDADERAVSEPPLELTLPAGLVPLAHVPDKYSHASLAEFLFLPLHVRPAGRMPDMLLSRAEARSIAAFVLSPASEVASSTTLAVPFVPVPELVTRGRALFDELRCAACHTYPDTTRPVPTRAATTLDAQRGCLADSGGPSTNAPRFALDDAARSALRTAVNSRTARIATSPTPASDNETIASTLTEFNCLACHVRGETGAISRALNAYFRTTQPDLGEEARIPPQLTHVGAKLQGDWLHEVLFDGARVRPYMLTRMPQFGEANLAHLADALAREDGPAFAPYEMPIPEGEAANAARHGGRDLLGVTGLGCVTCHDFNGTPSPGFRGLDLITTPERLQPAWFVQFVTRPQSLRPGIVMPESWPGGEAVHKGILGGDTDQQLQGIWYFLSQGRTADDPPGIRPAPTFLAVEGPARVYRGRSDIAGFRGIAVGFQGGLSYAFNAETGSLAGLWRGDFVSVRWDGQGAGEFRPREDAVRLAQDVGIVALPTPDAPWPLRQARTKENPVNPEPLYPRNVGYRFRGYNLDADSIPTLSYSCGDVAIDERSVVASEDGREVLRRTLRFEASQPTTLHMRVLSGDFEARGTDSFATPRLAVKLPDGAQVLHRAGAPPEVPPDLVLVLELPVGVSLSTIDYDLLR